MGIGWVEVGKQSDPFQYPYRCAPVHRNEIHWDMQGNAEDPLLEKSRWLRRSRWLRPERIIAAFPKYKDVIRMCGRHGSQWWGDTTVMQALDGGRINIATCSVGTAQQALDDALAHVQQRQQFGHPISEFQSVQFRLADMATELAAARLLVRQAAAKLDEGSPDKSAWCAMAKRFATDVGHRICDDALQLFGGYGYIREYPLERYLRDTRVHRILEGTNEVMRLIIARRLLADPGLSLE